MHSNGKGRHISINTFVTPKFSNRSRYRGVFLIKNRSKKMKIQKVEIMVKCNGNLSRFLYALICMLDYPFFLLLSVRSPLDTWQIAPRRIS